MPPGNGKTTDLEEEVPVNGDQWSAVALVLYVVILAGVVLLMTMIFRTSDLRRDIADLRRDLQQEVGAVRRDIEYRANRHDRDIERVLSEVRRSR